MGRDVNALFVAAGGGADVLAASILQRKLGGAPEIPVATYAWERLFIDPLPGPRTPAEFDGLQPHGEHNYLLSAGTAPRPPAFSLLPRLAGELDTRFFLLDPSGGAVGLRRQLAELVDANDVDKVYLVDSGGDIAAQGNEAALRSPLDDSLVLAAADGLGVPVDVLITAIGLDGELKPDEIRTAVRDVDGDEDWAHIDAHDTAWCAPVFSWHPSEVNGLLFAATQGFTGTVQIRVDALEVTVGRESAVVHRCDDKQLIERNVMARAIIDTTSLDEADRLLRRHCPRSELDYQRRNAATYQYWGGVNDIDACIARLLEHSRNQPPHVDAMTIRRIAEVMRINVRGLFDVVPKLEARFPARYRPPLWLF